MVPYRGVRYHLKEQRLASQKYVSLYDIIIILIVILGQRMQRSFLIYATPLLRNAIERTFGVLKRKFKILKIAPEYNIETQMDIIIALTALFNFTRIRDGNRVDNYINITDREEIIEDIQPDYFSFSTDSVETSIKLRTKMDILRDQIAEEMWQDYQQYIASKTTPL